MRKREHSTAKHHSSPFRGPLPCPLAPVASPNSYETSGPYVDPPSYHARIPSSPLPAVVFHAVPPGMGSSKPPNKFSSMSPAASISFAPDLSSDWWIIISFLYLPMQLL
uniref:Uncharacterized protein n=1 Tax=Arundo donax TaxID=35708 RepID=A0A0A9IV50_ARUDO